MATGKSEVISVSVQPHIKAALQSAADREMRSLANIMVVAYCRSQGYPLDDVPEEILSNTPSRGSAA